jgi:YHS domain-containing protein
MMRRASLQFLIAAAVGGSAMGPVELMAQGAGSAKGRLTLKGYDPVAYFTDGKATPGTTEFEYVWDGLLFRFASAAHRDLFKADPEKFAPQFAGSCAMSLTRGLKIEADPNNWTISNGKLFVFAGPGGPEKLRQDPSAAVTQAMANWSTLKDASFQ